MKEQSAMIFINNKYTNWYNSLINKAKDRTITGYTEKHHIIPSALGGTNEKDNIVKLTPREHFICHLLLTKMTTGNDRYKMNFALHMLSNAKNIGEGRYIPNGRMYDLARRLYKEALDNYWTDEKRKEHADKIRPTVIGRKLKETSKEKLRNKVWSEKALENRLNNCLKAAENRKGSKWSDEKREQMFTTYFDKNKHLSPQVFELADSGTNIRQISLKLGISWDRVKYILDNRDRINTL
jgi:hypothetical protein